MDAQPEQTMQERCVTITLARYNELVNRDTKLSSLEACGVDNWEGYDAAMELYQHSTG
jgi:hypothetical protein